MEDYKQKVKNKEDELSELNSRMDEDKQLYYLDPYELQDKDGKKIPGTISVTLNDPALFAAKVLSMLASATQQAVAEGVGLKDKETTYIEEAIDAGMSSIDMRLQKQGKPVLNTYFDEQVCIRGGGAFRCLFRMEEENLISDVIPLDIRYLTYEMSGTGLKWAAYKTKRNKDLVLEQYPEAKVSGKTAIVMDVWTTEGNLVYVNNEQVLEQAHSYGYPPVGVQKVALGSLLKDDDSVKHEGESIFYLIRDMVKEINRLVSILQSINVSSFITAYQYMSDKGEGATPPDYPTPGSITSVEKGAGLDAITINDIKNATRLLHAMLDSRLQAGSLSRIQYGNLSFPLSAVALTELGENQDQIFLPRLQCKGGLNQQLASMMINQLIGIGGAVDLGAGLLKKKVETSKLEGDYEIRFKYFAKSPKRDIANYSIASAAVPFVSEDTIRRDILKLEDPDGEKTRMRTEAAERADPVINMYNLAHSLVDEERYFEAELMAHRGAEMILGQAQPQPQRPQRRGRGARLPLFGRGGRQGVNEFEEEMPSEQSLARKEELVQATEEVE